MDTSAPKPFVFVLMPFDSSFDDLYKLGIKEACDQAGAYAERLDEQLFTENMLDRIYTQISKADVIVSDMTGQNPNVFYETGYAHALGKKVICITKGDTDIPFDLKHYPHIVHGGRIGDLRVQLERKVRWALEQPNIETQYQSIRFFVDGQSLLSQKKITRNLGPYFVSGLELKIDFFNSFEKQARTANFKIGILYHDDNFQIGGKDLNHFKQPDGMILSFCTKEFSLLPGSWDTISLMFIKKNDGFTKNDSISITLRLFSEVGVVDFPCEIAIVTEDQKTDPISPVTAGEFSFKLD